MKIELSSKLLNYIIILIKLHYNLPITRDSIFNWMKKANRGVENIKFEDSKNHYDIIILKELSMYLLNTLNSSTKYNLKYNPYINIFKGNKAR